MYLHIGSDCVVETKKILTILSCSKLEEDFLKSFRSNYEIVDATKGEACSSYILTDDILYLSPISSSTLKKRFEEDFLTDSVYSV
ncbi:MAG: DUF370 domain-containing protein [Acidaminococcaceae bacterium]|nr:DUF370 domain-containing protein [Acidaminococcaceae bacterium]